MQRPVSIKFILFFVLFLAPFPGFAHSCAGAGTVIFFANGMFNSLVDASRSLESLKKNVQETLPRSADGTDLLFDLSFKEARGVLEDLTRVYYDKAVDSGENLILWLSSLKPPPTWFIEAMRRDIKEFLHADKQTLRDRKKFFEQYSSYMLHGYNVIAVSHSQGNFYANQAMRELAGFTDSSLTGSLKDKQEQNAFFPNFYEIFANVQVATPVDATINDSPWSTFPDDWVIQVVRNTVGALPANLQTSGREGKPDTDFLGHNFIRAYMNTKESREKILSDIAHSYQSLRYPIGYFQDAVFFEVAQSIARTSQEEDDHEKSVPILDFYYSNSDVEGQSERWLTPDFVLHQSYASCMALQPGVVEINLSVISSEPSELSFDVWKEGGKRSVTSLSMHLPAPEHISFKVKAGCSYWRVGRIHTEEGRGKNPLQVKVEIFPQPIPRVPPD